MGHLIQVVALLRDIVVICIGGIGGWMMKRQLDLKQSEIEARKATEDHLRTLQAPALAQQLRDVSQIADQLAAEKQELQDRIKASSQNNAEAGATTNTSRSLANTSRLLGIVEGCLEGLGALFEVERSLLENRERIPLSVNVAIWQAIREKQNQLWTAVKVALKGQRPELPNSKAILSTVTGPAPSDPPTN